MRVPFFPSAGPVDMFFWLVLILLPGKEKIIFSNESLCACPNPNE